MIVLQNYFQQQRTEEKRLLCYRPSLAGRARATLATCHSCRRPPSSSSAVAAACLSGGVVESLFVQAMNKRRVSGKHTVMIIDINEQATCHEAEAGKNNELLNRSSRRRRQRPVIGTRNQRTMAKWQISGDSNERANESGSRLQIKLEHALNKSNVAIRFLVEPKSFWLQMVVAQFE